MTTARSAAQSLLWNYAGAAQSMILQLGYTALTARFVEPTTFGAYAIGTALLPIVSYFANGGISTCLLRVERLTRPLIRLALLITAVTGSVSFLVAQLIAPAAHLFWEVDSLVPLLRMLSFQLLVAPSSLAATAALRRSGHAAQAVKIELLGQTVGFAASITLLLAGWRLYALTVASPLASLIVLVGSLWMLARLPLPDGRRPRLSDLLGPSTFFAGYSFVQHVCNMAPLWLAGALLGPASSGYYSRAFLFTGMPLLMLTQGITRAAAPALAESRRSSAVYDTMCAASAIGLIGFGLLAGIGPKALAMLLGPGWEPAGRLVPILAVGSGLTLLVWVGDAINQVRHKAVALVCSQACSALAMACTLFFAIPQRNLQLLAVAAVTGPVAALFIQLLQCETALRVPILRAHAMHTLVGATLFAIGHTIFSHDPYGLILGISALTGVVALRGRVPIYALARRRGLIFTTKGEARV